MEIFLCGIFQILIAARKRPLRKHRILPNTEEIPVNKNIPQMEKCSCWSLSAPFLLVVMIRPQKDGNWGEREDLGNSERDPRSVFYLWLCERKEMFIQNAASGARKREEHCDPVTSMNCWLQLSLPASSAGSQPSRLQTSSPNQRGGGAGLE